MRGKIFLVAMVSALLAAGPATAREVTAGTAEEIQRTLTRFLPADLVGAGLLTVRAATSFYELRLDPRVLLDRRASGSGAIEGVRPLTGYLRPAGDGLYRVEVADSFDIKSSSAGAGRAHSFSYLLESMRLDGLYDPDILYFRSADWSARRLVFTSTTPEQTIDARFGEMAMRIEASRKDDERLDINTSGVLKSFAETITGQQSGRIEISADTVDIDVGLDGARYKALHDLVLFVLDNMHKQRLESAQADRFKELLRTCLPVFDNLTETITASNVSLGTKHGTFAARSAAYFLDMNGIAHSTRVGFGFSVDTPRPPPGLVSEPLLAAVPERATFKAAVADLDLAGATSYLLDNADFTAAEPLTETQRREIGHILLPGGAMTVLFDEISAASPIYDVRLTGRMTVYPEQKGRQSTEITITARDFDKTVAFLQQNAASVPHFGQAAFMLLMVKGFAIDAGDGSQRWDVAVGEDGKVLLNGRPLPFRP